jgi:elongation factor P--(R)-beta-lysine ligase
MRKELNKLLRQFLDKNNYYEVDVPTLSPKLIPESYLEVFQTKLSSPNLKQKQNFYLLPSPESYLKRLLVSERKNLFYLGKAYRNSEPLGQFHNHEFTILEWYRINYTYKQLMKQIEQMLGFVAKQLNIHSGINFQSPWQYLTLHEAYSKYAPGRKIEPQSFEQIYVQYIEPNLGMNGQPTFIYDFPSWQSPLAKSSNGLAERFELYINGIELVNGWTELTDPNKLKHNLELQNIERRKRGASALPLDTDFIRALEQGMPQCSGAAAGVDRLLMVLGNFSSIQETLLFPTKKLLKSI